MTERKMQIVMNGVTGRMGKNQHLIHSILAIAKAGGIVLSDGTRVVPDPILVGRNPQKLEALSAECGVERWTTDLDGALAEPGAEVYFDGGSTLQRAGNLEKAIAAGKHVYCEKPTAEGSVEAHRLYKLAADAGIKHGVVHDKLWAPGFHKVRKLLDDGHFGRVLSVRVEGCYWVFEGDLQAPQRPSWNYRKEDGGSMILDMIPHYQYMIELFGNPKRIVCMGATHIPKRWDEDGKFYTATADDAAYAIVELDNGIIVPINSSWCTRLRGEDIIQMHVDGTDGSAFAGLGKCFSQDRENTPRAQWSLDLASPPDYYATWQEVPDSEPYTNAFRLQWELFIRHIYEGTPFPWNLLSGAKGVQLAELAFKSWEEGAWMEVPDL
jgi:predicted dehydrogenase